MYHSLFDSHMHTTCSEDGHNTVGEMARTAWERGFSGITITDHCEVDKWESAGYGPRVARSRELARTEEARWQGRMVVSLGIEVGQEWLDPGLVHRAVEKHGHDFVIGSVHRMPGWPDLYTMDYATLEQSKLDQLFHDYFDHLEWLVRQGTLDVLGHMTYLLRSAMGNDGVEVDIWRYGDRIDGLSRLLAQSGRGIEVNTSGLRGPLGRLMPDLRILRRYRKLGGEIITIGSDAHRAADLGMGVQEAMAALEAAGFRYFCHFRRRKPVMLRLI